jgi:hypothetical protein
MPTEPRVNTQPDPTQEKEVQLIIRMLDGIHHRGELLESRDEQRVKLFLTLVSGSLALLTIAIQFGKLGFVDWSLVSTVLLFVLLTYGFESLHSLNWSRISIRENQAVEGYLLRRLASANDVAAAIAEIQATAEGFRLHAGWYRDTVRGNHVEFMYLTNGLLMSGALFSLGYSLDWPMCQWPMWLRLSIAFALFVVLIYLQYRYSLWIRRVIPLGWVKDPHNEALGRVPNRK